MKKLLSSRSVRVWLAVAGSATLILAATFVMLQQSDRLSANDQPLALLQSIESRLEGGATANDVVPAENVNLRTNNSVFAIVTDLDKHVLASSAALDRQSPLPPKGVFNYTAKAGSDTFTWEPASGVRLATYTTKYSSGFIITGQSLRPVEDRMALYGKLAIITWIAVLAWTFLTIIFLEKKSSRA